MSVALRLAWRYLRGRGLRSLLTTLAVALGVMLVFGLGGILPTMLDTFNRSMKSTAGSVDVTVTSTLAQPFDAAVVDKVGRVPGIAAAVGEIDRSAPLPKRPGVADADQVNSITVSGIEPGGNIPALSLAAGRTLTASDGDVGLMNADLAARLGLKLGDELTVPSAVGSSRLTIVGTLTTPTVAGQETVYVPLATAQSLFGLGGKVTSVAAALSPGADAKAVEASVKTALGSDYRVGGLSSDGSLLAALQMSQVAFGLFGAFGIVTAGFIIFNSFRTLVSERRRDIGMLRAVGTRRGTITRMFLAEALLQGVVGTGLGLLLGWAMAAGIFAAIGPMVDSILHTKMGALRWEATTWAEAIVLGIGVTVVAALLPARAAGRVTPMEALRPASEEAYRKGAGVRAWIGAGVIAASAFCLFTGITSLIGFGAVLFLIGVALVTPSIVVTLAGWLGHLVEVAFPREEALARSNLQRNPSRSATTVSTVMMGLASIVAMVSVIQAIFAGFLGYIDRSMSADYLVIPQSIVLGQGNVAAGPKLAASVQRVPGVAEVTSLRLGRGTLNGSDVQVIGIDPLVYPKVAELAWNPGSSSAALGQLGQGRWLIANGIFAGQAKLATGEAVTLDTPNGQRTYHVAGVGNDYLNAKLATVYVSQDALARDFNVTSDLLVMADRKPSADAAAVTAAIGKVVADYPAFKLYDASTWRAEQENTFNATLVIFDTLIGALAVPSLLALMNTLAMSVLARTREIGMIRAVGATRRQTKRVVLAESMLLSIIGTVLGVVVGVWLGYALVSAMSGVGWEMPYTFPWLGIVLTVVVGLLFAALAAILPARSASRLDVVAALHHE